MVYTTIESIFIMKSLKNAKVELTNCAICILLALAVAIPSIAQAQADSAEEGWDFVIAPYVYAPTISGDVKINRNSGTLSNKLSVGGMLAFEAYNPKWSIYTDLLHMNFDTDVTLPLSSRMGTLETSTTFFGIYAMRRVAKWFEVGLGGRLAFNNSRLKADPNRIFPEIDAEFNSVIFDPLLVYRFTFLRNDKWNIGLRGDVGGFGFYSIFTYMINPMVGYQISDLLEINLSYRLLSFYQDDEEGRDKFDLLFYGPQLGLLFHF
jgi:hypothetical protein